MGGDGGVPCTLLKATAIVQQSVYWQLKKHYLIAANFISLWPSHGSRFIDLISQLHQSFNVHSLKAWHGRSPAENSVKVCKSMAFRL